ncbi:MAG: NADH-quinone oxidoreductase subunit NuoF [Verrucomicrobiae bacterium]|nr:NADH-quinone oxidoreductase subunit NuoF [Verrucomicrobiae bacterium]
MNTERWQITVGLGSCGVAAGAGALYEQLEKTADHKRVELKKTGCAGICHREPMLEVASPGGGRWTYVHLTSAAVERILREHVGGGKPVDDFLLAGADRKDAVERYLGKQKKIVLENCGRIDPESIDAYVAAGGYQALRKVLEGMTPAQVVETVTASGLRGRGGAGFATGVKWKFTAGAQGSPKYMVCNGDEGDPGAFMDRSVLESDPHRVIEGMLIAGYAIGASVGFFYVRAEYPLAVKRIHMAIRAATEKGILGGKVMGFPFAFEIQVREGAGAFVCGEETALLQSIEGERGMPRLRPPFPAIKGLWGKPTTINNVETLANIPWIIRQGAAAFAAMGTEKSKGTKVFALAGKIKHGGLVEVPMGITMREIVEEIGGGSPSGLPVKAVQTGGPSGGCIPASLFSTRIDYDELNRTGAIMGSGGMVVMDESSCMVDIAKFFLGFTTRESCGKCTFCRIGTKRMLEILTRFTEGKGSEEDLKLLEELAVKVKATSLCGLGQTAPNPVLTTLRYFRHEYEAHIREKRCPAKACKALLTYAVDAKACTGCTVCARKCPAGAISGERKKPHLIDRERCTRCGICATACKFKAIEVS